MTATFHDDARDDVPPFEVSPGMDDTASDETPALPELTLRPRLTRAEMEKRRLLFVAPAARTLARGLVLNLSGGGGAGKTRLILQWLRESCGGFAPFGEETLRPDGPVRALYIGAEDAGPLFNEMALPLLADDDETLPFDVLLLEEQAEDFALDERRAKQLARFIAEQPPYDIIALEPLSALVPVEDCEAVSNQFVARQWQRKSLRPLLRAAPTAAFIIGAHDTKAGMPMSGSGDFINFGRSGLQLRAGGAPGVPEDVPEGSVELIRFKDNVGFRWKRMILRRDPHTLLLTVTHTEAAYGAASRPARRTQTEVEQYLATVALRFLRPSPRPDSERTRVQVEATLIGDCKRDGVKISDRNVGRFLDAFCSWRAERQGRSSVKILETVRDPSAAEEARYGS
jgi:hypothetical protein